MKRLSTLWAYLRIRLALFGCDNLTGDQLEHDKAYCCTWSPWTCCLRLDGTPVVVKAICYPYIAMEMERQVISVQDAMAGKPPQSIKTALTVNVIGAYFIAVDEKYVQASKQRVGNEEFPDVIGDRV